MIEIKCSVKIRGGGDGEQREPHVWKRRAGQTKTNPTDNFSMKASRSLFFIINIFFQQDRETVTLVFGAVTSSCASGLSVDKAATSNKIRSQEAHEYLKRIVEQHEETERGVHWMVEGWENKCGPLYNS